jgi:hypothetical protein
VYGSLARRAVLIVSAVAALASVALGPSTASADSLFQGAVTAPSPTPSQATWPSAANPFLPPPPSPGPTQDPLPYFTAPAQAALPPVAASPPPLAPLPPDVKVTSLGIARGASGGEAYTFQVKNVGQGSASEVKITRQAVVRRKGEKTWVRTEVSTYTHQGGLRPGQELVVEVTCPATDKQFCDLGGVLADVVGTPADANPSNNHMVELGDIK